MSATDDDAEYVEYRDVRQPPSPPPPSAPLPMGPPPPGPPVPMGPPASGAPPPMGPSATTVTEIKTGPGLGIRALWFVLVGWWLTGIVSAIAWFAMITLIGLPLGIYLINRIPTVITLRPRTTYRYRYTDELGRLVTVDGGIEQPPWYVRGLWFIFVGWWASGLAMAIGWVLIVLIITMPIGLMIYNRVPFVASLVRY